MRGRIITSDHRIFELPVLLRWNITYTGGVPCDSYEVTCVYDRTMAELLHLAAGFLALDENGGVLLRGIVDEYEAGQDIDQDQKRKVLLCFIGLSLSHLSHDSRAAACGKHGGNGRHQRDDGIDQIEGRQGTGPDQV